MEIKTAALIQLVCEPLCAWYKPDRAETLLCQGARIVLGMMRSQGGLPASVTPHTFSHQAYARTAREVCPGCDFRADGCDYAVDGASDPCGGLLYLHGLVASQRLSLNELKRHG